ncbi:MAG: polysaccharide pyruvyl transferase CsaB [Candidatus Margulisiibacteriota bacterium]|jgi:polysaccharide pyruvyl transferase CsaB
MKISLLGYYGFSNTGDEALLSVLLKKLPQYFPGSRISVLDNPEYISQREQLPNTEFISRTKLKPVWQALKGSDLFILGGGSILQDASSSISLYYYLAVILLATFLCKQTVLLAQGIGPIKSSINEYLTKLILDRVDLITCRDEESVNLLQRLGISPSRVQLTADLAYLLEPEEVNIPCLNASGKVFGLIWRKAPKIDYVRQLEALKRTFCNWQWLFIPFQPQDKKLYQEIKEHFPANAIVLEEKLSPAQMLGLITQLKQVNAIRLHGFIFAKMAGALYAGPSYDPKVAAFWEDQRTPEELKAEAEKNFVALQSLL